jgi:RHS repeat-associated protein
VVQELEYDAWGLVVKDTDPGFQPFGFAGGLYDPQTKLVRFGARDYDPTLGRWTAKDPVVFADVTMCGAGNLYQYACSEPLAHDDPSGRYTLESSCLGRDIWPAVDGGITKACGAVRSQRCAAMLQKFGVKKCMEEDACGQGKGGCKFKIRCQSTAPDACGRSYPSPKEGGKLATCGIALDNSRSGATQTCPQYQGRGYGPVIFHEFLHQCMEIDTSMHPAPFCEIARVCMGEVAAAGCSHQQ